MTLANPMQSPADIAATVNGEVISVSKLQLHTMQLNGPGNLQQMIDEALIEQAINRRRIKITASEVNSKIVQIKQRLAPQPLEDAVAQRGMTMSMFRSSLMHQLELEKMVTTPIKPALYMRHVWHISIGTTYMDSQTGKLKTRSTAQALEILHSLHEKLEAGANFPDLARQYSDTLIGKRNDGDLGILYDGLSYAANIFPEARLLKKGQYSSQPFKSYVGYELIEVSSTYENHPASEDVLYKTTAENYRQQQLDDAAPTVLQSLRRAAKIKVFNNTSKYASDTGLAATVNGQYITNAAWIARTMDDSGPTVLRHLIESTLIDQAAKSKSIVVTDSDVEAKEAELTTRLGGATLTEALGKEGMTMSELESNLDDQIKVEKLANVTVKPAVHMRHVYHLAISAQDAGPYAGNTAPGLPGGPQLPTQAQALSTLQMIQQRLAAGVSFQDLAQQYSDDIFSRKNGGDLGIMHDGTIVNLDILKVALSLNKGEYSQPFKSYFGYDLVYIESTAEDHPASEDSLYTEAANEYRDSQTDAAVSQVLQSLEKNGKVNIYFMQGGVTKN